MIPKSDPLLPGFIPGVPSPTPVSKHTWSTYDNLGNLALWLLFYGQQYCANDKQAKEAVGWFVTGLHCITEM